VMKGRLARVHITSRHFTSRMSATPTETSSLAFTTSTSRALVIELPSMLRKRLYPFQHLSPSIAPKRKFLAVDVTVNFPCPAKMSRIFKRLYMPETIEWE
jgi:hypothetical protein